MVGDHSVRLVGSLVGGHDQQGGGLQGVASADQVEGILNVVGTCRDQNACLLEGCYCGKAPRGGFRTTASLEEQVGMREGDDGDPCFGDLAGH